MQGTTTAPAPETAPIDVEDLMAEWPGYDSNVVLQVIGHTTTITKGVEGHRRITALTGELMETRKIIIESMPGTIAMVLFMASSERARFRLRVEGETHRPRAGVLAKNRMRAFLFRGVPWGVPTGEITIVLKGNAKSLHVEWWTLLSTP